MTKEQEMIDRLSEYVIDNPYETMKEAAAMIEALVKERDELKADLERERSRLAACGTAALGYFTSCAEEYRSASLDDVLRLYGQLAALRAKIDNAPVVAYYDSDTSTLTFNWKAPGHDWKPLISKEDLK